MNNEVEFEVRGRDRSDAAFSAVNKKASGFGSKLGSAFSKMGPMLAAGLATAGAAAGAALFKGITNAIQSEDTLATLQASLPPYAAKEAGEAAGKAFRSGIVPSMAEAADAVGAVKSSLGGLAEGAELDKAVRNALNFAKVFKIDVTESASVAQNLIKNGLAKDAEEAFDLMTVSARRVPEALRGEVMSAADEYGQFFNQLGIDGPAAFDLLTTGARKGQYGIDKAGDAIKEFTVRATDGSATSGKAFKTLGLDMDKMSNDLLAGGDRSRKAFDTIIDKLMGIKDPSKQAQTALALFGTPLEDLGTKDIPVFLRHLDDLGGGMGKVSGASEDMNDQLETNARKLQRWKNSATAALTEFGGKAISTFEKWASSPAMKRAAEVLEDKVLPAVRRVGDWLREKLVPVVHDLADRAMKGWNDATREISKTLNEHRDEIKQVQSWLKSLANFIADKVIPLVGPEFTRSIKGTTNMIKSTISVIAFWVRRFNDLKHAAGATADFVTSRWSKLTSFFTGTRRRISSAFSGMFDGIKYAFRSAVNWVIDRWNNFRIPGVSTPFGTLGGFNTPNIPRFASGGIGGGLVRVGERGPEVVRIPYGSMVHSNNQMQTWANTMQAMRLLVSYEGIGDDLIREIIKRLRFTIRHEAGGNPVRFWSGA